MYKDGQSRWSVLLIAADLKDWRRCGAIPGPQVKRLVKRTPIPNQSLPSQGGSFDVEIAVKGGEYSRDPSWNAAGVIACLKQLR